MKKLFTLIALCLGISSGAWADATTIYERGYETDWSAADIGTGNYKWTGNAYLNTDKAFPYVDGNGGRTAPMAISPQTNSILTIDAVWYTGGDGSNATNYTYFRIGNNLEIQAHTTNQVGNVVINGVPSNISNACGKSNNNRTDDFWTIHAVINTSTNTLTALTISGANGTKKASYTLASETALGSSATYTSCTFGTYREKYAPYCGLPKIKIQEETQTIPTYDYNINYKFGETTVKTTSGSAIDQAVIDAESPFTVEGQKYYIVDAEPTSLTIDKTGSNKLDIQVRKANVYTCIVNAVDESSVLVKELKSQDITEGETYTYYAPKYITDANNKVTHVKTNETYYYPNTVASVTPISVSYQTYNGNAWFVEGEDVLGSADVENGNLSNGHANRGFTNLKDFITVPQNGKYQVTYAACNNNVNYDCGIALYRNAEEFLITEKTDLKYVSTNYVKTTGTNTVNDVLLFENDIIKVKPNTTNCIVDYILIVKTGEAPDALVSITPAIGYATFYDSEHAVNIPDDVTPYIFGYDLSNSSVLTLVKYEDALQRYKPLTYNGVIPAGEAVVLKGDADVELTYNATCDLPLLKDYNYLCGKDVEGTTTPPSGWQMIPCTYYALSLNSSNDPNSVGFYFMEAGGAEFTTAAHKAYLWLPFIVYEPTPAPSRFLFNEGEATAIKTVNTTANRSMMFNLAGQRVNANAKGIVVVNGKKHLAK